MKYALVTSPHGFEYVEYYGLGYHLVLAQEVLIDPAYREFYIQKHRQGHFIIMDNGAAELGRSITFSDVVEAAQVVGADEIALPDVLKDRNATFDAHIEALDLVPAVNRMVIPQGSSIAEWIACLDDMLGMFDFRTIGVPKHLDDYVHEGGRLAALKHLSTFAGDLNVHLLGCSRAPLKEVREAYALGRDWIRGIDTAAPLAYAQFNQNVGYTEHLSYNWKKAIENKRLAHQNILTMIDACQGL